MLHLASLIAIPYSYLAIVGAGGMGREALAWLRDARPGLEAVAFFVANAGERPTGVDVNLPVTTHIDQLAEATIEGVVLGIGDGIVRRRVADEAEAAGLLLVTPVHPTAFLGPGVTVGDGYIVAPGFVVTRDVRLGRGVIVNCGANVGHDCVIGDFAFIGPGAVLTGFVRVAQGAILGAKAVVLPSRSIGRSAHVGAGAVVAENVPHEVTVVGVPARSRSRASDSAEDIVQAFAPLTQAEQSVANADFDKPMMTLERFVGQANESRSRHLWERNGNAWNLRHRVA